MQRGETRCGDCLWALAQHPDPRVRLALLASRRVPAEVLELLVTDPDPLVADRADRIAAFRGDSRRTSVARRDRDREPLSMPRTAVPAASWLTDTQEQPRADALSGSRIRRRARFYRVYLLSAALLCPLLLLALAAAVSGSSSTTYRDDTGTGLARPGGRHPDGAGLAVRAEPGPAGRQAAAVVRRPQHRDPCDRERRNGR